MTNKEYIMSLNTKEMAKVLLYKPWQYFINGRYIDLATPYADGLNEWLEREYDTEDYED